ncbi:GMP synthase [Venturia nashicola]|uniref:GMP synthase n=1 Tax=Venturia nashicola TaxID=86259 RepID=A0A4Z1PJ45_9PEZI|nr:GMP synthase [Venturia nashicola]
MKLPLRIAVLECDTPLEKTKAKYGGYGGVFKQLLQRGADKLGHPGLSSTDGWEATMFDVENNPGVFPKMDDIDAIILTGSRHDSFADVPWINQVVEFVKQVLASGRVRIFGVCFGHQIVGRALGQRVYRGEAGWEVSQVPLRLSEKGKEIFKVSKMSLYQMHKDIVYGYPSGTEELGETDICLNQGMYIKNKIITVQGHPEFTHDIVEEILKSRHEMGIFTDEMFEDAMRRLPDHDDGVVVAQAVFRFLLED